MWWKNTQTLTEKLEIHKHVTEKLEIHTVTEKLEIHTVSKMVGKTHIN